MPNLGTISYQPTPTPHSFSVGVGMHLPQRGVGGETMWLAHAYTAVGETSRVYVVFSNEVRGDTVREENFGIVADVGSAARTISSVTQIGTHLVRLDLDGPMTPGTDNYQVSASEDLRDVFGRSVRSDRNTFDVDGPTAELLEATAVATDSTHVRVTFSVPVLNNAALRCIDAYHLTRRSDAVEISVYSIAPGGGANPTYVDLTVDEQRNLAAYDVVIDRIEPA